MNSPFITALQSGTGRTHNDMPTNVSTGNPLLDLFGVVGSMRGSTEDEVIRLFTKAFAFNKEGALRLLFWLRDIRGGAGERKAFRVIAKYLAENYTDFMEANISIIAEYGRWDDYLVFFNTPLEKKALWKISDALKAEDGREYLCKKWMPRKGADANKIRAFLGITPKAYRKLLASAETVEQKMSEKDWEGISYENVPSLAFARLSKAFARHNSKSYQAFKNALETGDAEINASAVFPHDVVRTIAGGGDLSTANAQWLSLPNYVPEGERLMPVVDVSGSMGFAVSGKITALDVAISLGMYLAERNQGDFQHHFITFSQRPELIRLQGSLSDKLRQLRMANWQMNTNIEAVFDLILRQAVKNKVDAKDMPTKIIILSDMEFDRCTDRPDHRVLDMIRQKYAKAGYQRPNIVFWNLHGRDGNNPVREGDAGTQFLSGFSPSILKTALTAEIDTRTPEEVMHEVLWNERYDAVKLPS